MPRTALVIMRVNAAKVSNAPERCFEPIQEKYGAKALGPKNKKWEKRPGLIVNAPSIVVWRVSAPGPSLQVI